MSPAELLAKFIDPSYGLNPAIRTPIRQGGFLYGTNGEIMVRISDDTAVEAVSHQTHPDLRVPNCELLFTQAFKDDGFVRLDITLPEPPACITCHGKGKFAKCPDCDGVGSFDHGSHNYDCKECDGDGVAEKGNHNWPVRTAPAPAKTSAAGFRSASPGFSIATSPCFSRSATPNWPSLARTAPPVFGLPAAKAC
jgi:hypothetical protein